MSSPLSDSVPTTRPSGQTTTDATIAPKGVHDTAARGFDCAAREYESTRPGYPIGAIDLIVEQCAIGPETVLLDLAAGTGKLTRPLAATGATVIAGEPVEGMARRLSGGLPTVQLLRTLAESLPFAPSSFDAVTVGQAFHWFDETDALAELARVLAPGGGLALVWNVRDESVPWVRSFTEIIIEEAGGTPYRRDYTSERWHTLFARSEAFTPLEARRIRNDQEATVDLVVERAASTSFVAALPAEHRAHTLERVRRMLEMHPELQGVDTFPFPHDTDVFWCHRR